MAILKKEQTNKFLEVTDPKKAVGLWSYRVVRETAMTPVGNTAQALGRFLNGDIARWECRGEMAEAMEAKRSVVCEVPSAENGARRKFKSPARIIAEYQEEAKQDAKRMEIADWQRKYRWLRLWERYSCRLAAPSIVAGEKDVQMFFGLASAGVGCNEKSLHGGRVFFLRKNGNYFVAVVLKPGGTKWWWSLERVNVTWTEDTYDRLIIDPRGKLEWSPMDAGVLTAQVVEKNVCLFQLEDDALFKAITDNDLNPSEKYAHLCYDFDFFCRNKSTSNFDLSSTSTSRFDFYLRWSAFFNPRKSNFDATSRQTPRIVEVMSERKKGWITRQIEVKEVPSAECGVQSAEAVKPRKINRHGNKSITALTRKEVAKARLADVKLGLGDTPLDKYVQGIAKWVAENNGCAVLPIGASRELRLALSHALFFVTFPDRKPDELGGILRGYQLPGRLVEHAAGKVRGDNSKAIKERSQKQSEEATERRRKMVVDCLFARACAAVLSRNKNVLDERSVVTRMNEIGARRIVEKAAWQRGFMEGNPLNLFKPGPTAGNLKLPDLSLALMFENRLGLKGETAGDADLLVQTSPIRSLKESQGAIRESISGCYPCRSVWTPKPGKGKELVAYSSDSVRVLCDEGRYYLMTVPKFALYQYDRDLAFEPDEPGKKTKSSVPVFAYSFKTAGGVRSRADSMVIKEVFDYNKVTKLAREGRICLYSIDFGKDKWIADLVYSTDNKRPCKIVPTIPILAPVGVEKNNALQEGRKNGSDMETTLLSEAEAACAFIGFTFNPSVSRDPRKVEGRSWKSYCDAFPAEERRTIIRWPQKVEATPSSLVQNGNSASLTSISTGEATAKRPLGSCEGAASTLQKVIETDGVLLTDKEHLDEALRAATYVVPHSALSTSRSALYRGYNLKDRIFRDTDARVEWREKMRSGKSEPRSEREEKRLAAVEAKRQENKGKPLCEVLSPALAKEAEAEFTRQIEADAISVKVGEAFKEAVAREFRRIAYTGTMGWKKKLNRPAHEVALGIWLSRL